MTDSTPRQKIASNRKAQEQQRLADLVRLANDRSRMILAFNRVLTHLGVPDKQIHKIVADVRACDFTSLDKLIKGGKDADT